MAAVGGEPAVSCPLVLCVWCNHPKRHTQEDGDSINSSERHEARYQRRKTEREKKKRSYLEQYDNYSVVFSYQHLYDSYKKCVKNVGWKASTQRCKFHAPMDVYRNYQRLEERTFRHDDFHEFWLTERGKKRFIQSVTVRERIIQRCLCDHSLVPAVTKSFVYDNGASMKYKGYSFAVRRLETHLHKYFRKHGSNGYILLFDFSKFFDNVSHAVIRKIIDGTYEDEDMRWIIMHLVSAFGDTGLGLGSQISQVLSLASANELDHYIKERLHIKYYGRYMDDGYLIHQSKQYLTDCLDRIGEVCDRLGIKLNRKKTHVVRLSHGFTYLKIRVYLTTTGRVIKKIYKRSITVMRRKLKAFRKLVDAGTMSMRDVETGFQSWLSYASTFDSYYTVQSMKELYKDLFGPYRGVRSAA